MVESERPASPPLALPELVDGGLHSRPGTAGEPLNPASRHRPGGGDGGQPKGVLKAWAPGEKTTSSEVARTASARLSGRQSKRESELTERGWHPMSAPEANARSSLKSQSDGPRDLAKAGTLDDFKKFLIRKYGNYLRAWYAMDRDANGKLTYHEFATAARQIGFYGDIRALFDEMDREGREYVVLDELDRNSAVLICQFSELIKKHFGCARDAMLFALDRDQNKQIYYEEFRDACDRIGFSGNHRHLFKCLDLDGNGFITLEELQWAVDKWHATRPKRPDLDPRNWGLQVWRKPRRNHSPGGRNRRPRGKFSASSNRVADETHETGHGMHGHQQGRACVNGMRVGVFGSASRFNYQRNENNAIARREVLSDLLRSKAHKRKEDQGSDERRRFEVFADGEDVCFDITKRSIEEFQFRPYYDRKGERDLSLVNAFRAGLPLPANPDHAVDLMDGYGPKGDGKKLVRGAKMSQQFSATGDYTPWNHLKPDAEKNATKQHSGPPSLDITASRSNTAGTGQVDKMKQSLLRVEMNVEKPTKHEVLDRFNMYFAPRRSGYGEARGLGNFTVR